MSRRALPFLLLAALALSPPSRADDGAPRPVPSPPTEVARRPTFEVYGFAQVDFIEDFKRVAPDWNATLRPTRIPTVPGLYGEGAPWDGGCTRARR